MGDVAYPFIWWKLFFGLQVSSTDHYMISVIVNTWQWDLQDELIW